MTRIIAALILAVALTACGQRQPMTYEQQMQAQNNALLFNMLSSGYRPAPVPFYPITGGAGGTTNCISSGLYMTCTGR